MKISQIVLLITLISSACNAQIGLKQIEEKVGTPGLAESLAGRMTSAYTIRTDGLESVKQIEWHQYLKELNQKGIPLKSFTIGSGDSDSPEARFLSVFVSTQKKCYWLLPHTPENSESLVYGPILIPQVKEEINSILVSVHTIKSAQQSPSERVQVTFQVHEPVEARNSTFLTISSSTDRSKVRSKFPLGGLFFVEVPTDFLSELKEQKLERLKYETFIDTGADPREISQLIEIPEINFSLIERTIVEYGQKPKQSNE